MNIPYQLKSLFPLIDVALFLYPNPDSTLKELYPKALWISSDEQTRKDTLLLAKTVFIHPDGVDTWKQYLLQYSKELHQIRIFIFADSDLTLGHTHIDELLDAFPTSVFWIQNWFGCHPRVFLLPIGVNGHSSKSLQRWKPLGISFFLQYPGFVHREEFYQFVQTNSWIHPYCLPCVDYEIYCSLVSECRFSCCPMGGGYDTYRFWECLMMKTIPIVKSHLFYDVLRLQYPLLPFLVVEKWEDIETLLPRLTPSYYESLLQNADLSPCYEGTWIQRGKSLLQLS